MKTIAAILRKLKSSKKYTLIVMRANEMFRIHPQTDWSHRCSKCEEPVGIFPSGQNILKKHGVENVDVICIHCRGDLSAGALAPGALTEFGRTIENPAVRKPE